MRAEGQNQLLSWVQLLKRDEKYQKGKKSKFVMEEKVSRNFSVKGTHGGGGGGAREQTFRLL